MLLIGAWGKDAMSVLAFVPARALSAEVGKGYMHDIVHCRVYSGLVCTTSCIQEAYVHDIVYRVVYTVLLCARRNL